MMMMMMVGHLDVQSGFQSQVMSSTADMLSARAQCISWKTLALK